MKNSLVCGGKNMGIISSSIVVILINNIMIWYQNSNLYKTTYRVKESASRWFGNSFIFSFLFKDKEKKYFENSITYKTIIWTYNIKKSAVRLFIKWSESSFVSMILRGFWKFGASCFELLFKIYRHSMIYTIYLDWIESESI